MTERLILNQSQARAIYDAMCALNNVGPAGLMVAMPDKHEEDVICVTSHYTGVVVGLASEAVKETYPDQAAFAAAYDL